MYICVWNKANNSVLVLNSQIQPIMKRIITTSVLLSLVAFLNVSAQDLMGVSFVDPEGFSYQYQSGRYEQGFFVVEPSAEIDNSGYYKGNVVIPDTIIYNNVKYPVKGIGSYAFADNHDLTSIYIPKSVATIGEYAFENCTSLETIDIHSKYLDIESYSFHGCSGLNAVTLPEGVIGIGQYAFCECTGLTSVTIPSSVSNIGNRDGIGNPFIYCPNLESINIRHNDGTYSSNNNVIAINGVLISGCKNSVIPNGVVEIQQEAFAGSGITSLEIPNGVSIIGENAFAYCKQLESINIPASVKYINGSFIGCEKLSSITVDPNNTMYDSRENCNAIIESVDITNYSLFSPAGTGKYYYIWEIVKDRIILGCKNTVIPSSVTSIAGGAFYGCAELESFVLPENVIKVGYGAFIDCNALTSLSVSPNHSIYDSRDNCNAIIQTDNNELIVGCKNTTIPDGIKIIGAEAFMGVSDMSSVEIPYGVTIIGSYAFRGCNGLTSVTIPDGVNSIADCAFASCKGLQSIDIPSSVRNIGNRVFEGSSNITSLTISNILLANSKLRWALSGNDWSNCDLYLREDSLFNYSRNTVLQLFKSYSVVNSVNPVRMDNKKGTPIIYDIMGRIIKVNSPEDLQPGLYIIDDKKYLRK